MLNVRIYETCGLSVKFILLITLINLPINLQLAKLQ